jgi:DNA-binding PadR family transcriptional regulator
MVETIPGSVYPLLEQLQKDKSIKKLNDGRYELTEKEEKNSSSLGEYERGNHAQPTKS